MADEPREAPGEDEADPASDENQGESHQVIAVAQGHFSGPLPPPTVLQGYDDVLPGAAERIVQMAEKEQRQRHSLDDVLAASATRQRERGQWFAFMLGGGALALAAFMVQTGHPGYAIVAMISSIAPLAGALIYRRKSQATDEPRSEV